MFNSIDEAKGELSRNAVRLCAAAAVTAPKSGGRVFLRGKPLFIETVFVDDRETLLRLAGWMLPCQLDGLIDPDGGIGVHRSHETERGAVPPGDRHICNLRKGGRRRCRR